METLNAKGVHPATPLHGCRSFLHPFRLLPACTQLLTMAMLLTVGATLFGCKASKKVASERKAIEVASVEQSQSSTIRISEWISSNTALTLDSVDLWVYHFDTSVSENDTANMASIPYNRITDAVNLRAKRITQKNVTQNFSQAHKVDTAHSLTQTASKVVTRSTKKTATTAIAKPLGSFSVVLLVVLLVVALYVGRKAITLFPF